MARVKRTYAATETVVQWVIGTKPGGKYLPFEGPDQLTKNLEAAKPFPTEQAAKEALALSVRAELRGNLRVIRVSRTIRESCDD